MEKRRIEESYKNRVHEGGLPAGKPCEWLHGARKQISSSLSYYHAIHVRHGDRAAYCIHFNWTILSLYTLSACPHIMEISKKKLLDVMKTIFVACLSLTYFKVEVHFLTGLSSIGLSRDIH